MESDVQIIIREMSDFISSSVDGFVKIDALKLVGWRQLLLRTDEKIELPKNNKRYEIQHFDYADGGRSWLVYDNVDGYHIHTATHGHLNEDNSVPESCVVICDALNAFEMIKTNMTCRREK